MKLANIDFEKLHFLNRSIESYFARLASRSAMVKYA